ncbi:family 43 glycosylhydrolase [soil metagenome]
MKGTICLLAVVLPVCVSCAPPHNPKRGMAPLTSAGEAPRARTFANPLDLDYRFMTDAPSAREAADPLIVLYGDDYFLFASKSGGYWHSRDMRAWTLVVPRGYLPEEPAPAVVVLDGRMYYTAHKSKAIYATDDPGAGEWRKVADIESYADPAFFLDDDGRLYLYFGSALNGSIAAVELDPHHDFKVIGGPFALMRANYAEHGWERSGEDNLGAQMAEGFRIGPYIEGPWMTKHDGTYYLQYSAPGTVWKSYADGVYTSTSPTSGFVYAPYSPFSYKPGGFIGSAGHAGTFRDKEGRYWRVVTMDISVVHKFERRIGIFPAGFDADGVMRTDTYLGDYPQYYPGVIGEPLDHNRAPWMLLSGAMHATASTSLAGHPPEHAFDEDIRTHWSGLTGGAGEWLRVDLGHASDIHAIQVNLGEQNMTSAGRTTPTYGQYLVYNSLDDRHWEILVDRSNNRRDAPHEYVELGHSVRARYVRITNSADTPAGGKFSIRDLRVFGVSPVAPPAEAGGLSVRRHEDDRSATLTWNAVRGARGYIVRFGLTPEKLYGNYQVSTDTTVTMNSLNRGVPYYFAIDVFNEGGVTRGRQHASH